MPSQEPSRTPDLAALVGRLRLAGFRVDTRQYLTANELLLSYAASGAPLGGDSARLISHLGPIFCTTLDEQERFAGEVAAWTGGAEPPPPPPPPPPDAHRAVRPFAHWRRARWWRRPIVAAIPIVVVALALLAWYYVPVNVQGRVSLQLADGRVVTPEQASTAVALMTDGPQVEVASDGTFVLALARGQALKLQVSAPGFIPVARVVTGMEPLDVMLVAEAPRPVVEERPGERVIPEPLGVLLSGESSEQEVQWSAVATFALVTAAVALALLWIVERLRYRLALRSLPVHGDPETVTLAVPETPVLPVPEQDLNRAAVGLLRLREETVEDLDVMATVEHTARNAGFFHARFVRRRAMPEYLVLIGRRGAEDHQARVFDVLFEHLSGRDVVLDRYSFHDDPRVCWWEQSGRSYRLSDVLDRHHRATLIVCGETMCAFNRVTGALADWVNVTRTHAHRFFLTIEAPDRWTSRDFDLERAGFVVLPASEAGWRVLRDFDGSWRSEDLFPAPYTRAYPAIIGGDELRWLDRNEPPRAVVDKLLKQIHGFLGPDGFSWLCACAIYPELTWALTLRLMGDARRVALLPSLARLPWFRRGLMPDWLRRALVARIPPADEGRLRVDLERLLEDLARGHERSGFGSLLQIGRWLGPIHLMRAAAPGSPLRDHVFLGFMAGARRDPLWLQAPQALKRLFGRRPATFEAPLAGPRPAARSFVDRLMARIRLWTTFNPAAARLVTSIAIGAMAILPLQRVLAVERVTGAQETVWFAEVPAGPFFMGGDEPNSDPRYRRHQVTLPAFFIGRTEVTRRQYQACVSDGACRDESTFWLDSDDTPVRNISLQDALGYCAWLESKLRALPTTESRVIDALAGERDGRQWRVTLPSEAEWEKAAALIIDDRFLPPQLLSGTRAVRVANFNETGLGRPSAVGTFPVGVSVFGALDMAGNVAEWTRTVAGFSYPYRNDDRRERLGTSAEFRVVRGGSFRSGINDLRADARTERSSTSRIDDIGFRVVVSPDSVVTPGTTPPGEERPLPSTTPTPRQAAPQRPASPPVDAEPCVARSGGSFPPVYFDFDRYNVNPASARILDAIADTLRQQPGTLVIEGHTDWDGSAEYNLAIAERQATSVRDYLVSRGISADRLRTVSYGEERPQCSNASAQGRAANRRVEFVFSPYPVPEPRAPAARE